MANKIKHRSEKGYTVIQNTVLNNNTLNLKERGMLCTLLSLPENWEFSVEGFATMLPDGKAAIRATVQSLEEKGYVRRTQSKDENNKYNGYDWEIADTPIFLAIPSSDFQTTEKQTTEKQTTEKQTTENRTQYNKQLTNTNESNPNVINQSINQRETDGQTDRVGREYLKTLLGYEHYADDNIACDLFEICFDIMNRNTDIIVGKTTIPLSIFQDRIKHMDHNDIMRITKNITNYGKEIKSMHKFMTLALYNESVTNNARSRNDANVSCAKNNNTGFSSFDETEWLESKVKQFYNS